MAQQVSRLSKLNAIKRHSGVDAFLLTSSSSVKYFSGYFFYFEYGNSPFHLVPAILAAIPDGEIQLIQADNEMGQSDMINAAISIASYASYRFEKPTDPVGEAIKAVVDFIEKNKLTKAKIGIEQASMPFALVAACQHKFPSIQFVECSQKIAEQKIIKDQDEIESIRDAAKLSDAGQLTVLKNARQGMSELELFSLVHMEMEKLTGFRVPLMADLSSGAGTNSGGGMPSNKLIQEGDLVLSDFQACLRGYWGDSCSTIVIGKPTADQTKTFQLVKEALEIGITAIRPGVRANEIDRLMRAHIGNYPHHSGHGVGTGYHEEPRITPYNETALKPGMIVALEPAIYRDEYGIRLEHLMLVTESGSEIITQFKHQFEQ